MGLKWESLNWQTKIYYLDSVAAVFMVENTLLIVRNQKVTSFLRLNSNDLGTLMSVTTIETEEAGHLLDTCGTVLQLSYGAGQLFRLLCSASAGGGGGSDAFGFGGPGSSSETETYSWSKLSLELGNVICCTGTKTGFAAIVNSEGIFYLKIYEMRDKPIIKSTLLLPVSGASPSWFIYSIHPSNLSPDYVKHLFGKLTSVLLDVVIIASPAGLVSILPILADNQRGLMPIHCDSGFLLAVEVTPCKQALVFIYEGGKIVFAVFKSESKSIQYRHHYLSSKVKSASVVGSFSQFRVVWSDGFSTYDTKLTDLTEFVFQEYETPLKGIVKLFKVGDQVVGCNMNGCFYKITCANDEHEPGCSATVDNITEVGLEIDRVNAEIQQANDLYYALINEQMDSSQFVLKLCGSELTLGNVSSRSFYRHIWAVKIMYRCGTSNFVRHFSLAVDLHSSACAVFALDNFVSAGCVELEVSLIGTVSSKTRLLAINVGSVPITNSASDAQVKMLDKVQSIFKASNT